MAGLRPQTLINMNKASATSHFLEQFNRLSAYLPGQSPWIKNIRQEAISVFQQLGFPTRHHEAWKYTNVTPISQTQFTIPQTFSTNQCEIPDLDAFTLFLSQGNMLQSDLPTCVQCIPLTDALNQIQQIKPYLNQTINPYLNAFSALNTAFLAQGYFLVIPDNVVIEKPIHVIFYNHTDQSMIHLRNILVVGKNSQVNIIEHYIGSAQHQYLTNSITECYLADKSKVTYAKLQQESASSYHIHHLTLKQSPSSQFTSHAYTFGGRLAWNDIRIALEERAHCRLFGLFLQRGKQHSDHQINVTHQKSYGQSHEYYKGILAEHSSGVFNSNLFIAKDAQKNVSQQMNKNLLLSPHARMNTKPQLKVHADDVQCTHGATVGQLDPDTLFYLHSRGLKQHQAQSLLLNGFAQDLIKSIPFAKLQAYLLSLIQQEFNHLQGDLHD